MPPRLTWVPSLDGLRGLAVIAVVAFHAGHLRGGYLGVDLFFTVSGFLITRLILDDLGRDRFSFSEFWGRRARRLLPALWLLLAVIILATPWLIDPAFGMGLRRSVVATAIYIANWWQLAGPGSYWQALGAAAPLNHTWSLAIEEQFYVLWPIVSVVVWRLARRPARALLAVAGIATLASVAAQVLLYRPGTDGARVYLGTDTRAASILIGCAAAILLWTRGHRIAPRVWHALHLLAPVALLATGVAWFLGREGPWLYHGGLPLLAIGAAIVLASSSAPTPSRLNRVLSIAPLVLIGKVSYGIYLWHWPVFSLLGPEQLHTHGWPLLIERLVITGALVAISYTLIERPYRFRLGPLPIRFFGGSACVTGVIVAVLTWPTLPQVSAAQVDQALSSWGATVASTTVAPSTTAPTTTVRTMPPEGPTDPSTTAATTTTAPTTVAPATAAPRPPKTPAPPPVVFPAPRRLLVVGDSVADLLRRGFRHQAPTWLRVIDDGRVACSPGAGDHPQVRFENGAQVLDSCRDAVAAWPERVRDVRADGVLMVFGTSGLERQFDDGWRRPCDPKYDAWFQASVEAQLRAVKAAGARVWITLAPYNRHASVTPELREQTDRQTDCLNRIYWSSTRDVGGVAVIDLHGLVCPSAKCTTQVNGIELRPDGLHFQGPGADVIAHWLVLQLGPPP
jgi:peptidoglycan/LPS O-acetylase OafA/YrhL